MAEQKQFSSFEENQQYLFMAENEPRAVFVDTSLDTHLAVAVSPLLTVSHLQQQISLEHFNCFPKFGRIMIKALSVELNGTDYHLPETMLLKTAFNGSMKTWIVSAEVWKPIGSLEFQKDEVKHVKSSQNHHKPSPKHGHDHKHVSSQLHETPKKSSKKKKNKKERKDVKKIDIDINKQLTSKTGSQDRKTVLQKNHPVSNAKEQLDEKTRNYSQMAVSRTGEDSGNKHLRRPCQVHNPTVVQSSVLLMEDGNDNVGKNLQGTSIDLAENFTKESGTSRRRSRKTKKKNCNINGINQSAAVTSANGPASLEKGDAPSGNGNTIHKSDQKGIEAAAEVSPSQLNNVQELLSQQVPLNLEMEIEEDFPLMKSDNISKKRKACESGRESRKSAQKLSPLHLNNVPELLAQGESLNLVEKEKGIEEDVVPLKLENTAKKRKTNKAKSSSTNQEFSGRNPNDNEKTDVTRHISGEPALPDDVGRPDEIVETVSVKVKNSQNRKAVLEKDSPVSSVKEQPDEEMKKMASTITAIQSDKPNKRSQKKHSVLAENLLGIPGSQHSNETVMEMDAPKNVDDDLTKCDANDALLKSENTARIWKTNDNGQECRTADVAAPSLLNDVSNVIFEDNRLNQIENEKKIEEDVALLKSENTAKKRKTIKAKNSGTENKDSSSRRLSQDVDRPEGSLETMNGNLKRSRNRKDVPGKDNCGSPMQEQLDEETREDDVPISIIQRDKPKKRTQKKQLDEKTMKMDALKRVEQADGLLTNIYNDDSKNQKKVIQGEGLQDKTSETLPLEGPVLADMRHPDKPRASKQRTKKLDQLNSIETSSNGHSWVESKKNRGSGETTEHQMSISNQRDVGGVSHASVEDGSRVSGANFTMEMDAPKRVGDSLTDSKSTDVQYQKAVGQGEGHGELSQVPGPEVSAVLDEARHLEKPQASKQKAKKVDQHSAVDTSSNGHTLVNQGSPKTFELQKSVTDQKHNKSTSLSAKHSTVSKNMMDTLVSPADLTNTSRNTGVSCASLDDRSQSSEVSGMSAGTTVRKLRHGKIAKKPSELEENGAGLRKSSRLATNKVSNASEQKSGGLTSSRAIFDDGNSSSSDEEDRTDASSSRNTLSPEDSEDESKDSFKNHRSSKANSSGMKLESILRSSSRYKKAKLMASQSQGESEPPEFVPDSQADM